jgi:hypothetical protein
MDFLELIGEKKQDAIELLKSKNFLEIELIENTYHDEDFNDSVELVTNVMQKDNRIVLVVSKFRLAKEN